jgi:hypothetical protein
MRQLALDSFPLPAVSLNQQVKNFNDKPGFDLRWEACERLGKNILWRRFKFLCRVSDNLFERG